MQGRIEKAIEIFVRNIIDGTERKLVAIGKSGNDIILTIPTGMMYDDENARYEFDILEAAMLLGCQVQDIEKEWQETLAIL